MSFDGRTTGISVDGQDVTGHITAVAAWLGRTWRTCRVAVLRRLVVWARGA
ncbi:hypothetical protein [Streptomyces hokutonensis]|uniref:hypothetical protein n=1 Tax=Streptomyces hokutonensis TaxID=1306990 RepID=UPI0033ECEA39